MTATFFWMIAFFLALAGVALLATTATGASEVEFARFVIHG